jgi:hypothetical protein
MKFRRTSFSSPVDVAITPSGAAAVINTGEFDCGFGQPFVAGGTARADPESGELSCRHQRLGRSQTLEVKLVDHPRIREGHDVHDYLVLLFEGIDVMEGEDRPAPRCSHHLPSFLLDDVKSHPTVRLPLVIPDERFAAELEPKRALTVPPTFIKLSHRQTIYN